MAASESPQAQPLIKTGNIIDTLFGQETIFKDVEMYGTIEEPLISANDVGKVLELQNIRKTIAKWDMDLVIRKCPLLVIQDGGNSVVKYVNVLTEEGFYEVLSTTRSKYGRQFRRFVTVVLKELRLKGSVDLQLIHERMLEKNISLQTKNSVLTINNHSLRIVNDALEEYKTIFADPEESVMEATDPNKVMITQFKQAYGSPVYIYAVLPSYVNTKPKSQRKSASVIASVAAKGTVSLSALTGCDWGSDDEIIDLTTLEPPPIRNEKVDPDALEVDYTDEDFHGLRPREYNEFTNYYFHFTKTRVGERRSDIFRFVTIVYLGNVKDYAKLKTFFRDSQTRRSGTFATSIRAIKDQVDILISTGLLANIDAKAKKAVERAEKKSSV